MKLREFEQQRGDGVTCAWTQGLFCLQEGSIAPHLPAEGSFWAGSWNQHSGSSRVRSVYSGKSEPWARGWAPPRSD